MRPFSLRSGVAGLALICAASTAASGVEPAEEGLQPFQLVRSLELIQDRIADGDHAALPMQRRLLEMIDARFRKADSQDFADPKNLTALLVYAMSGGNPVTVDIALSRLGADDPNRRLGAGILFYLQGRAKAAQVALGSYDPLTMSPEVGAYVALVKGSTLSADKPEIAVQLLDMARLLGPGTLVEEAALRRSIAISAALGDARRFMLASAQYVRGFIRSPYASQFADAFVEGVIALHTRVDLQQFAGIAAMMDPERERVIYLRIARRAAIEGFSQLSAFAAERAASAEAGADGPADPRALLYSSLASITSQAVPDVTADLARIDRNRLSSSDRLLLDAARAIATELTARPGRAATDAPSRQADPAASKPVRQVLAASGSAPAGAVDTPSAAMAAGGQANADPADIMITETRKQLAEIDKLLAEAAR